MSKHEWKYVGKYDQDDSGPEWLDYWCTVCGKCATVLAKPLGWMLEEECIELAVLRNST